MYLPQRVARMMAGAVITLALFDFAGQFAAYLLHYPDAPGLTHFIQLFDLDGSHNIPSYYEAFALLFSAGLLAMIGFSTRLGGKPYSGHWFGLAATFLYLSFDKALGVHGVWMAELGMLISPDNYYFAKTLPLLVAVGLFGLSYWKFFLALPFKSRLLFSGAALVFLAGSVGMEVIEGLYFSFENDFAGALLIIVENILEMSGIIFLIYALLSYQESYQRGFQGALRQSIRLVLKLRRSYRRKLRLS
jgi:hypothetical protein